jgi:tRNA (cytidine32/guanosine34-2'-O)-methyltransferase
LRVLGVAASFVSRYIQGQLLLSALSITAQLLRDGGTFVAKIFRGRGSPLLYAQLCKFFADVCVAKPKSSRNSSVEAFVVCRGFRMPDGVRRGALCPLEADNSVITPSAAEQLIVPFVACGDLSGYDADANYDLELADDEAPYVYHEPTQKPTTPAYRTYLEQQQSREGRRTVLDVSWASEQPRQPADPDGTRLP